MSGLNLPLLEGITFHVGHPWYGCNDTDGNSGWNIRGREPDEFFGDASEWKLSGFTLDMYSIDGAKIVSGAKSGAIALKEKVLSLNADSIKQAFNELPGWINSLRDDTTTVPDSSRVLAALKKWKSGTELKGGFSFSPVLAVGIQSTESDW